MAIQPIDLQTLFTQIDKVGKNQSTQKEGVQIQQAVQGVEIQKKIDERIAEVNQTQDTGEGTERVKDRNAKNSKQEQEEREKKKSREEEEAPPLRVVTDPALGKNIDVSG